MQHRPAVLAGLPAAQINTKTLRDMLLITLNKIHEEVGNVLTRMECRDMDSVTEGMGIIFKILENAMFQMETLDLLGDSYRSLQDDYETLTRIYNQTIEDGDDPFTIMECLNDNVLNVLGDTYDDYSDEDQIYEEDLPEWEKEFERILEEKNIDYSFEIPVYENVHTRYEDYLDYHIKSAEEALKKLRSARTAGIS